MACYHIIIRHASMRTGPALKRCHRNRKAAEAVRQRGATGDRADYSLTLARRWAWWNATIRTIATVLSGPRATTPTPSPSNQLGASSCANAATTVVATRLK